MARWKKVSASGSSAMHSTEASSALPALHRAFANTSAMEVLVINPMVRMMTMLAMAVTMPQSSTCWR